MKIVIVGLGTQGKKRKKILKKNSYFASVDTKNKDADFKKIEDVPLGKYNTVFICTPDYEKIKIINFCIKHKKNILVEKPLVAKSEQAAELLHRNRLDGRDLNYNATNLARPKLNKLPFASIRIGLFALLLPIFLISLVLTPKKAGVVSNLLKDDFGNVISSSAIWLGSIPRKVIPSLLQMNIASSTIPSIAFKTAFHSAILEISALKIINSINNCK